MSMQVPANCFGNNIMGFNDPGDIHPKPIVLQTKHKYRLIQKSTLEVPPVKSLPHIFQKPKKNKAKGLSHRKLKYILPKVTKFSPIKMCQQRILKAKALPIIQNGPPKILLEQTQCDQANRNILNHTEDKCIGISPEVTLVSNVESLLEVSDSQLNYVKIETAEDNASLKTEDDNEEYIEEEEAEDTEQQQEEEYLAAFIKASSTIASQKATEKKGTSSLQKHWLTKQQCRLQDRIAALSYIPDLESHQDADDCKKRGEKRGTGTGTSASSKPKPWPLADMLSFLGKVNHKRESISNTSADNTYAQGDDETVDEETMATEEHSFITEDVPLETRQPHTSNQKPTSPDDLIFHPSKWQKHNEKVISFLEETRKERNDILRGLVQKGDDDIDLFFKCIAMSVKKLRPDLINEAKMKSLHMVFDLESRNSIYTFAPQHSSSTSCSSAMASPSATVVTDCDQINFLESHD